MLLDLQWKKMKYLMEEAIEAHRRSYQRAFETAVRTGTALVYEKNGKIVEYKPPYRYELVPIKPKKKKSKKKT